MKRLLSVMIIFMIIIGIVACENTTEEDDFIKVTVMNPYANVSWNTVTRVKANLHTHTQNSDGAATPHDTVDFYQQHGYGILALTDHHVVTYPWTFSSINSAWEDRDPESLGMLAIPGNEFSNNHHFVALFTDYDEGPNDTLEMSFANLYADPLATGFWAHPGRYWDRWADYQPGEEYSPEWYMQWFNQYPLERMLGIEVFNHRAQHRFDRVLWDILLTESMPNRPIWGFGTDDYHGATADSEMRGAKTVHLMNDPTSMEDFRQSLFDGAFYFTRTAIEEENAPIIERIIVDETAMTITVQADDYEVIRWISGYNSDTMESIIVHEGNSFDYSDFSGDYVRAEVIKNEGDRREENFTYTQPFGFNRND